MHMADALISPVVGGAMWAATAGLTAYSARKLKEEVSEKKVPLMGVLGAFVFAAQMINFTIPGTGSSGHLGGGMLLAILLGPHAAFLTMASILTVQSLLFADGGLLALGCNIFNLGFFPCFIAYPLFYKRIAGGDRDNRKRMIAGAIIASIVGLQLGAFGVVVETLFSKVSELPFGSFLLIMQPIHLAIGIVEGFVTAAAVSFLWKARPEALEVTYREERERSSIKPVLAGLALAALFTAGFLSWFASPNPDGLEWSIAKASGKEKLEPAGSQIHSLLSRIQDRTALLPDYNLRKDSQEETAKGNAKAVQESSWPSMSGGTSLSGILGGTLTLALAGLMGFGLRVVQKRNKI